MKRSKKITIGIITFFVVVAVIVIGRYSVGLYFKKKFSKRPPPGVIVEVVSNKNFSQTWESYCTSLSSKTISYKIKKNELLQPIKFNIKVKKNDIIAKLVNTKNNTFFNKEKLKDIFISKGTSNNDLVMSCGSSVSASSLALAYSIINDDYMAKIYIGRWTEYGKK